MRIFQSNQLSDEFKSNIFTASSPQRLREHLKLCWHDWKSVRSKNADGDSLSMAALAERCAALQEGDGKGSRQMRNANDEIMKKPSSKTKQSLQPAKALKQKVVEHKNKVPPQVYEAQPEGRLHSLWLSLPLPLQLSSCCATSVFPTTVHCLCVCVSAHI